MRALMLLSIVVLLGIYGLLIDAIISPSQEIVTYEFVTPQPEPILMPMEQPLRVTVTLYQAVSRQTDSTPHIMASGKKIELKKAGSYRYCALSRELLERWDGPYAYGDTILIEGAEDFSGFWIVQDTMHPRFKGYVDLLTDVGTPNNKFVNAKLWKVN